MSRTKEQVLIDDIKLSLVVGQLYRKVMYDLSQSETLKEWAKNAKKEGNKFFVDLRPKAADAVRLVDANVLVLKKTIDVHEFRNINMVIKGEAIDEMNLLLVKLADASVPTIRDVNEIVKEAMEEEKKSRS